MLTAAYTRLLDRDLFFNDDNLHPLGIQARDDKVNHVRSYFNNNFSPIYDMIYSGDSSGIKKRGTSSFKKSYRDDMLFRLVANICIANANAVGVPVCEMVNQYMKHRPANQLATEALAEGLTFRGIPEAAAYRRRNLTRNNLHRATKFGMNTNTINETVSLTPVGVLKFFTTKVQGEEGGAGAGVSADVLDQIAPRGDEDSHFVHAFLIGENGIQRAAQGDQTVVHEINEARRTHKTEQVGAMLHTLIRSKPESVSVMHLGNMSRFGVEFQEAKVEGAEAALALAEHALESTAPVTRPAQASATQERTLAELEQRLELARAELVRAQAETVSASQDLKGLATNNGGEGSPRTPPLLYVQALKRVAKAHQAEKKAQERVHEIVFMISRMKLEQAERSQAQLVEDVITLQRTVVELRTNVAKLKEMNDASAMVLPHIIASPSLGMSAGTVPFNKGVVEATFRRAPEGLSVSLHRFLHMLPLFHLASDVHRSVTLNHTTTNGNQISLNHAIRNLQENFMLPTGPCEPCPKCAAADGTVKQVVKAINSSSKINEIASYFLNRGNDFFKENPSDPESIRQAEALKAILKNFEISFGPDRYKNTNDPVVPYVAANQFNQAAKAQGIENDPRVVEISNIIDSPEEQEKRKQKALKRQGFIEISMLNISKPVQTAIENELFEGTDLRSLQYAAATEGSVGGGAGRGGTGSGGAGSGGAGPARRFKKNETAASLIEDLKILQNFSFVASKIKDSFLQHLRSLEVTDDEANTAGLLATYLYNNESISKGTIEKIVEKAKTLPMPLPDNIDMLIHPTDLKIAKLVMGASPDETAAEREQNFKKLTVCTAVLFIHSDAQQKESGIKLVGSLLAELDQSVGFNKFVQAVFVVYRSIKPRSVINVYEGETFVQVLLTKILQLDQEIIMYVIQRIFSNPEKRPYVAELYALLKPISALKVTVANLLEPVKDVEKIKDCPQEQLVNEIRQTIRRTEPLGNQLLGVIQSVGRKLSFDMDGEQVFDKIFGILVEFAQKYTLTFEKIVKRAKDQEAITKQQNAMDALQTTRSRAASNAALEEPQVAAASGTTSFGRWSSNKQSKRLRKRAKNVQPFRFRSFA